MKKRHLKNNRNISRKGRSMVVGGSKGKRTRKRSRGGTAELPNTPDAVKFESSFGQSYREMNRESSIRTKIHDTAEQFQILLYSVKGDEIVKRVKAISRNLGKPRQYFFKPNSTDFQEIKQKQYEFTAEEYNCIQYLTNEEVDNINNSSDIKRDVDNKERATQKLGNHYVSNELTSYKLTQEEFKNLLKKFIELEFNEIIRKKNRGAQNLINFEINPTYYKKFIRDYDRLKKNMKKINKLDQTIGEVTQEKLKTDLREKKDELKKNLLDSFPDRIMNDKKDMTFEHKLTEYIDKQLKTYIESSKKEQSQHHIGIVGSVTHDEPSNDSVKKRQTTLQTLKDACIRAFDDIISANNTNNYETKIEEFQPIFAQFINDINSIFNIPEEGDYEFNFDTDN